MRPSSLCPSWHDERAVLRFTAVFSWRPLLLLLLLMLHTQQAL